MRLWLLTSFTLPQVLSSGVLEFRFDSFENPLGRDSNGKCCSNTEDSIDHQMFQDYKRDSTVCLSPCRIYFRVCLKHFQHNIDINSPCTFGEFTTPVLGNNTIQTQGYIVPFFFNFSWPVSYNLKLFLCSLMIEFFRTENIFIHRRCRSSAIWWWVCSHFNSSFWSLKSSRFFLIGEALVFIRKMCTRGNIWDDFEDAGKIGRRLRVFLA